MTQTLQQNVTPAKANTVLYPHEHEQAGNAYLMSVVAVLAGLPLPIINVIASLIYLGAQRKSSYYVRWHSLQSVLAQVIVMPFNSILFAWTINIFFNISIFEKIEYSDEFVAHVETTLVNNIFDHASLYYWMYLTLVIIVNLFEFIGVIITAVEVRKGKNVRWFGIAKITDVLCSKQNRDPYSI